MLSHKTMTVAEFCRFCLWVKAYKGFDADEIVEDPDGFEEFYDQWLRVDSGEQVPAPVAPTMHGLTTYQEIKTDA